METEEFTILMALIGFAGSCLALTLQFALKSRCQRVSCCGRECLVRDVLPAEDAVLDVPANLVRTQSIPHAS